MRRKKVNKILTPVLCAVLICAVGATGALLYGGAWNKSSEQVAEAGTVYSQGSTGKTVSQIQTALKNRGYYTGSIDGIFGKKTTAAVKSFQKANGLVVDGVVGSKTAKALGISLAGTSSTNADMLLLARLIYGEARGEAYLGQVAVGAVVLNRVKSSLFPNTISGVIYQAGAFDAVRDGQVNLSPNDTAKQAARDALNGWDPTGGCLYYYNPKTATSKWMLSKTVHLRIGNHAFCL